MRSARVVGAVLVVALAAVGCADVEEPIDPTPRVTTTMPGAETSTPEAEPSSTGAPATATPTSGPSDSATTDDPTTTPSASTPFDANTETDTAEPEGTGTAALTDVTVGDRDEFAEIVFTTTGDGEVGWRVGYVDEAVSDGSGDSVEVTGEVVLEVVLTGVTGPFDAPESRDTADPDLGGSETFTDVVDDAWFEGQWTFFVGLDERRPFRVMRGAAGEVLLQVDTTS